MRFPSFINRYLNRRGWQRKTYEDLTTEPLGKSLSYHLTLAVADGATKVTYGLPPGISLEEREKQEIESEAQERFDSIQERVQVARNLKGESAVLSTQAQLDSVQTHRRDQLSQIPLWYYVDGTWHHRRLNGSFAEHFPYFQQHVAERVVSINATSENEQPAKWIEYTNAEEDGRRNFVEVDLVYEEHGSFTIELLGTRVESTDVQVSRYPSGHSQYF